MSIIDDLKREFKQGTALNRIIYINIAVFVLIRLLTVIFDLFGISTSVLGSPLNWVAMPSSFNELLTHFWTPFTYMFTHFRFIHLLVNLLWIYWFAKFFLLYYNDRQLISLYITGGLAGAAMFLAAYHLLPFFAEYRDVSILLGASASALAIVLAVAATAPNQEINLMFIGPVKFKYLAMVAVFVDLISVTSTNAGGHLAHLGGALWGWLFVVSQRRGVNLLGWMNKIVYLAEGLFKPKKEKQNMKVKWNRPQSDQQYRNEKKARTEEIDVILDKIKQSGYESLSKEEKQKLFNASEK